MREERAPHLKPLERVAAAVVLIGSFVTLAYAAGESWFG